MRLHKQSIAILIQPKEKCNMSEYLLSHLWYFVVGFSLVAYVVLDGFDLGVGMLHLFVKKDEEKRLFLNAIGPVWDGNEVWLVVFGGALFAGFAPVYAAIFSGFYDLAMLFLAALIFRAVAIEFRSKEKSLKWRYTWDTVFGVASFSIAFGAGLVLGNIIQGIPLNADGDFIGTSSLFFSPYPILIGFLAAALFLMHGSIYLVMKTEGELHDRLRVWSKRCMMLFFLFYFMATCATLIYMPYMAERMRSIPWVSILPLMAFLFFFSVPRLFSKGKDGVAFIFSCLGIASLLGLVAVGTYPVMVRSSVETDLHSLTILNSCSSVLTLKVLLVIVMIGIPMVLGYGIYIYRVFRGKVKIGPSSY
jgi:cytochrome bd ubiquinol oxidase subunit II